jgi:acetyl-CoA C-acetyltransferase
MKNGQCPSLLSPDRWNARMGDATLQDSMLTDGLNDAFSGQHASWNTEDLVRRQSISREDQDRWALRWQKRFAKAQAAGHFEAEIAIVEVPGRKDTTQFRNDQHNRPDTSPESLARLKPAFARAAASQLAARLARTQGPVLVVQ